jgi:ribosomal protein L33
MGHFTKGQSGQMEKTKEKIIYITKKNPRQNPHLIEMK